VTRRAGVRKSIQRIAAFVAKWIQRDRVSSVVRLGHAIRWLRALSTFTLCYYTRHLTLERSDSDARHLGAWYTEDRHECPKPTIDGSKNASAHFC